MSMIKLSKPGSSPLSLWSIAKNRGSSLGLTPTQGCSPSTSVHHWGGH